MAVASTVAGSAGTAGALADAVLPFSADPLLEPRPRPRSHFPAAFGPARCFCPALHLALALLLALSCSASSSPSSACEASASVASIGATLDWISRCSLSLSLALSRPLSIQLFPTRLRKRHLDPGPFRRLHPRLPVHHVSIIFSLLLLRLFDSASGSAASPLCSAQVWLAFGRVTLARHIPVAASSGFITDLLRPPAPIVSAQPTRHSAFTRAHSHSSKEPRHRHCTPSLRPSRNPRPSRPCSQIQPPACLPSALLGAAPDAHPLEVRTTPLRLRTAGSDPSREAGSASP